ncbi:protein of unknown function [Serratia sp. Tan611]|nr:protein of unknown function [Serratia sp. Tan611]
MKKQNYFTKKKNVQITKQVKSHKVARINLSQYNLAHSENMKTPNIKTKNKHK